MEVEWGVLWSLGRPESRGQLSEWDLPPQGVRSALRSAEGGWGAGKRRGEEKTRRGEMVFSCQRVEHVHKPQAHNKISRPNFLDQIFSTSVTHETLTYITAPKFLVATLRITHCFSDTSTSWEHLFLMQHGVSTVWATYILHCVFTFFSLQIASVFSLFCLCWTESIRLVGKQKDLQGPTFPRMNQRGHPTTNTSHWCLHTYIAWRKFSKGEYCVWMVWLLSFRGKFFPPQQGSFVYTGTHAMSYCHKEHSFFNHRTY